MQVTTVGLDLAKHVFQVHGIDQNGQVLIRRQLRRGELIGFFRRLPPCLIGMEACPPPTSGRVSWRPSGTRSGLCPQPT